MSIRLSYLAAGVALLLCWPVFLAGLVEGTPLYAARSGRVCDNCHLTPNNWENPELAKRKCSLACQICHIDPAGGGLRNASGRFFGRSTLPVIATSPRPTADWDRSWWGLFSRIDRATTYSHDLPLGPASWDSLGQVQFAPDDFWGRGTPVAATSPYSLFPGRYGALNADPILRVGWDVRAAVLLSGRALAFPMQADLGTSFHPVEHLTFLANVGARGRTGGIEEVAEDERTPYLREAFILLHEAPYQTYVKAGRFVPTFGLRLDDHTSFIRRRFELDGAIPESRVTGVEIGAAPNYPYFNASWFWSKARDVAPRAFDLFDVDEGWGSTINLGYRSEGWGAGAGWLNRQRPPDEGGDATTLGGFIVWNPWHYWRGVPLTYQVEFDRGTSTRFSDRTATAMAFYQEIDWLVGNGLIALLKHDWEDPDREIVDDEAHRIAGGIQVTPVPGVTLDGRIRALFPAGGEAGADLFVQIHLWN